MPSYKEPVKVLNSQNKPVVELDEGGKISVSRSDRDHTVTIDGERGHIYVGGPGMSGGLSVFHNSAFDQSLSNASIVMSTWPNGVKFTIRESAVSTVLTPMSLGFFTATQLPFFVDGYRGNMELGAPTYCDADLALFRKDGSGKPGGGDYSMAAIHLSAGTHSLVMRVKTKTHGLRNSVVLDAGAGNIALGCPEVDGNLALFRGDVSAADVGNFNKATIHLNGQSGDIILSNADCAEDFEIAGSEEVAPGTVMVIDEAGSGRLRESSDAYDRRVVGVLSGAGEYRPGIVLGRQADVPGRAPVAVLGKVFCKVDASEAAIDVGDMLTTSPRSGHAMKVSDERRAFGAVLGKALGAHREGVGLIPVLVALQ
jgi:hypothetical protein